jgi:Mg-chelatase subunit ChlD
MDVMFVLDTSASMEGEGFRQMKGVVIDILNGNYIIISIVL